MKNKFSVLMSVYHKEKPLYLDQSLNSIFNQTIQPTEVILVEDGPIGDSLKEIINNYQSKFEGFKIIHLEKNQGLSSALNIGLRHCSYDYVARMDTDDICQSNRFEKQVIFLNNNPIIDIVGSYGHKIDSKGKLVGSVIKVPTTNEDIYKKIWTSPFIHVSVMFRKNRLLSIGGYNPNSGPRQDDYELWFRCALSKFYFANIPEVLVLFRFFDDSIRRNTVKVGWYRFKVGFKGCKLLQASPFAYVGITIPLIRSLLPYPLNKWFQNIMNKLNPRHK